MLIYGKFLQIFLKIRILNLIENINEEDGYKIVNLFLEQDYNNDKFKNRTT